MVALMLTLGDIAKLCDRVSDLDQQVKLARKLLSELPPSHVLKMFFKTGIRLEDPLPAVKADVLSRHSGRRNLFAWVYRNEQVARELNFVRLPSPAKMALTKMIVRRCESRFPWLRSRLLHAMAFSPDYFKSRKPEGARDAQWRGLYRTRSIRKGNGKRRILEIPYPPLRRVQRVLLDSALEPALRELPQCVMGCRSDTSIFRNALAHVGQEFVVTLDLANFFGSVRPRHLIPALSRLTTPLISGDAAAEERQGWREEPQVAHTWDHQVAVLVTRLTTFKNHLPQGSPTSPALAHLAFRRYDRRIRDAIGESCVYTRYVDDITVSISRRHAKSLEVPDPDAFRRYVEPCVRDALLDSGFHINEDKTRSGMLSDGVKVTGLRATQSAVDLPRAMKRRLRSLGHHLRRGDFVEAAWECMGGGTEDTKTRNVGGETQAMGGFHIREGRRLSSERMAVLMLRALSPDMRLEVPAKVEYAEGHRMAVASEMFQGREAMRTMERLLAYLWQQKVVAVEQGDGFEVRDREGRTFCTVKGGASLSFIMLPRAKALACVEFWHYVRGLVAFLNVRDLDPRLDPIRAWHKRLGDAFRSVEIRAAASRPAELPADGGSSESLTLTEAQRVGQLAKCAFELLKEFRSWTSCDSASTSEWTVPFLTPGARTGDLAAWLKAAEGLFIAGLPYLPSEADGQRWPHGGVFEAIRVLAGRVEKKRSLG